MIARMRLEEAISETLQKTGPCCLDDLVNTLPNFRWGEVFLAVDRMSRDRRVVLRQLGYSTYQISRGSQFAYSSSTSGQTERTTRGAMPMPQVTAQ